MTAAWRAMVPEDLGAVKRIAELVHPDYPEDIAVPRERLQLFPGGCRIAVDGAGCPVGYAVAHPWLLGAPPALDSQLGALPETPDCLYLHDAALLPAARGLGLGAVLVRDLAALAAAQGLGVLALVAVGDAAPYWARRGFEAVIPAPALAAKLASYGGGAAYMTASIATGP